MPVQYSPLPEFQAPNINILGAYAQGQAMNLNRLREQMLEQQLAEAARQQQAEEAFSQYTMQPGFDPTSQATINRAFALNPTLGRQMLQSATQAASERSLEEQRRGGLALQQQEWGVKRPYIEAQTAAERALEEQRRGGLALQQEEWKYKRPYMEAQTAELGGRMAREEKEMAFKERKFGLEERELAARVGKEQAARIVEEAKAAEAHINKTYDLAAKADNPNKWLAARAYGLAKAQPEDRAVIEAMWPEEYSEENKASLLTTADQARKNYADNFIKQREYEYKQVQEGGKTRVVAIPKYAPQAGAFTVPGTEGAEPQNYGFMAGPPDTGLITRTNPRTGQAELVTPSQPIMTPPEGKMTNRALIPSEIRPTAEAPVGSAAYNNKRFATEVLDAAGFNAETGEDTVSKLIRESTSGGLQAGAANVRGFFGGASPGMKNIARLETIKNDVVLKKLSGKLGAGISEGDRQFIEKLTGDIANPNVPADQRLSAWNQVKSMMVKYANTGGQPAAGAPANRKPLSEIFQ